MGCVPSLCMKSRGADTVQVVDIKQFVEIAAPAPIASPFY
jgi:hypothetical protein